MLDKFGSLENKGRIVCGDSYIEYYQPDIVWRSRGKGHLRYIGSLTTEDAAAVKAFIRKALPAAEKKPEELVKLPVQEKEPTPSRETRTCVSMVKGAVVKCQDYSGCWDGPFLRDDNKCGHKGSRRPRPEPTPMPKEPNP